MSTMSTTAPPVYDLSAVDRADRLPSFIGVAHGPTGKVFAEPVDVVEAIEQSGLDYIVQVTKDPVLAPISVSGGTVNIVMEGYRGVIRLNADGTRGPLGVVKSAYRTCQNGDAFTFAQSLIDDWDANVVAAAAHGNPVGARAYLALLLPDTLMVGGQDPHDVYVIVENSHDGSSALTARVAPIRRASGAEISAPLAGAPMRYALRHTGDLGAKMRDAAGTMQTVRKWTETYEQTTWALLAERMTRAQFEDFARKVFPTPAGSNENTAARWAERREALTAIFTKTPDQAFGSGTRYAAFTALCEYVDFHAATRGGDPTAIRRARVLEGRAAKTKALAWEVLAR